jgi:HEAT repeat protein
LLTLRKSDRIASLIDQVGTESAHQCASGWVEAPQARVRALGFEVLGYVALDDERAQAELLARARAASSDRAVTVREAAVHAVGQSAAEAGRDWLLRMAGDGHPWVREAVVSSLPLSVYEPAPDDAVVQALLVAMEDEDVSVRNWATFSLGTLLDVDSPEIREALRRALAQIDADTVEDYPGMEAVVGLARRGDAAALPTLHQRLAEEGVTLMTFTAAAALADVSLLPALLAHRTPDNEPGDPWVVALEEAITACTAGIDAGEHGR